MTNALITAPTLLLEGVLAGIFVGSQMMEHAARHLGAPDWIAYNRAKDAIYGPTMPVVFGVTLVASIIAVFAFGNHLVQAFAAGLLFAAGIITAVVHLPLNRTFQGWSAAAHPRDWDDRRRRWRDWNAARTVLVVLSFAVTVISSVLEGRGIA